MEMNIIHKILIIENFTLHIYFTPTLNLILRGLMTPKIIDKIDRLIKVPIILVRRQRRYRSRTHTYSHTWPQKHQAALERAEGIACLYDSLQELNFQQ